MLDKRKKWMMRLLKDLLLILLVLSLLTVFFCRRCDSIPPEIIERTDTLVISDTIFKRDTLTITKPIPKYVEVVKIDTVFTEKGDTIQLFTENKTYIDSICAQNDTVIITNYIQGINAQLDSTKVDWRKQEIIKTLEITKIIKQKPKKFTINPQLGVGYGIMNKRPDVWLGVGISYNF